MAKLTVNDDPVLCTPGGADGSCNRGFPRCDDPAPANCQPTSTRCCMQNNAVYDYLTDELPGELDWNFVSLASTLPPPSIHPPPVPPPTGRLPSQLAGQVPDRARRGADPSLRLIDPAERAGRRHRSCPRGPDARRATSRQRQRYSHAASPSMPAAHANLAWVCADRAAV